MFKKRKPDVPEINFDTDLSPMAAMYRLKLKHPAREWTVSLLNDVNEEIFKAYDQK